MLVTLEEMKNYLRVDYDDDDSLIETLIASAKRICMDILRVDDESLLTFKTEAVTRPVSQLDEVDDSNVLFSTVLRF